MKALLRILALLAIAHALSGCAYVSRDEDSKGRTWWIFHPEGDALKKSDGFTR